MDNYIHLIDNSLKNQSLFYTSQEKLRVQQNILLRACFEHHYNNCEEYRKFCQGRDVYPNMVNTLEDMTINNKMSFHIKRVDTL